jgi:outer membrane protein assembly factor BamE
MRILIILSAALALSACKQNVELPSLISPYRIDIQQGNVVTQEMVSKLKAGMTRSQVRFVLGSPLVTDMFHSDRWDYVYLMQKQGKADERRRLTVMFDGDKLVTLEGDIVLTDRALEPPPAPKSPSTVIISTEPKPAPAKPAAATPAPKPEAAKPALKPPVATTPPAKPEATVGAPPAAPKSEASAAPAAKPAAAKDDAQPAIATPAAKPAAREAEATKADGDADKSDPAKADASKSDPAKLDPAKSDPAKSDAAKADAVKADAPKPDATKADPEKTDAAVPDDKNDPSKRGIFGRMLDKIGF